MKPIIKDHTDGHGNVMRVERYTEMHVIKLLLPRIKQTRHLGRIHKPTRVLYTTRVRSKHLHRNTNSYAFNEYLIRNSSLFDFIELKQGKKNRWVIPVSYIREYGIVDEYGEQGFEKQIFISLESITQFKK